VYYGLALASKNAGLLLLPALLVLVIRRLVGWKKSEVPEEFRRRARQTGRGLLLFMAMAVVALLPFANPVSYANEVLTPFTERAFDPRGEDVSQFSLSTRLQDPLSVGGLRSARRGEIMLVHRMSMADTALLFIILAVLLATPAAKTDLARLSLYMMLLVIPYQIVFGRWLSYRYLLFLPFFIFLLVELVQTKYLRWLMVFVLIIDVIMLIDPMTAGSQRLPVGPDTLWKLLLG
jgi:hypothetical protein